ncbi:hypothetical protein A2380_00600 [candidate division WWE3 bacterium RIFOXYB1_FULL_43_24]|uniref:Uncharacterized protein n=2 Tax=Katanobacteria TaxID=422282 RepID=A0A0G1BP20_UNCKA
MENFEKQEPEEQLTLQGAGEILGVTKEEGEASVDYVMRLVEKSVNIVKESGIDEHNHEEKAKTDEEKTAWRVLEYISRSE